MDKNKRILKTGLLALAVTVVFAAFVFRIEEWSKGFDGEFLVYGQTAGTGGSSGGTGSTGTAGSLTKIVPQIVVGSYDSNITKYVTVIQVANTGTASINVSGNFYKQDGTASTLSLKTNLGGAPVVGTLAATALAPNRILVLTADSAATGTTNWARIITTGSASVSAYFELRDSTTNVLYNRVGVASSAADMSKFVIPRVRNVGATLDVGFALVNTGATTQNITGVITDANGVTVATRTLALGAGNHTAGFAREFFSLTGEPTETTYSAITFTSTASQFAAVALAIEGASLASFPVDRIQ